MTASTDHAISCPDAIAKGKVCSHAVTRDQLLGWGFDCGLVLPHSVIPGPDRRVAVMAAWHAGFVKMCTLDPASTGRPWLTPKIQSPESIAEALAFPTVAKVVAS